MLKHIKIILLFALFLTLAACGTTQKVTMLNTAGEIIPNPYYNAKTTGESKLFFTWFYAKYQAVDDKDGSVQAAPVFLSRSVEHQINKDEILGLDLTMRVYNPQQKEYQIFINKTVDYTEGSDYSRRFSKGSSFLEYRVWKFHFPCNDRIKEFEANIEIWSDNTTLLRTRTFKYSVN